MKKYLFSILSIGVVIAMSSCDKIDNPYIQKAVIEIDTTLFPGNWSAYTSNEWPTFDENTNTDRNILLEDYTGHQCSGCPAAATEAKNIHDANPTRVFATAIHTSPGGAGPFQSTSSTFTRDFTTPEGEIYGDFFGVNNGSTYGFYANPSGNINRFPYGPNNDGTVMFDFWSSWSTRVTEMLSENNLRVNIQAKSNFYPETSGGYIHAEVDFEQNVNGNFKIVGYVLQNSIIDKQLSGPSIVNDYNHEHVFIGTLDGNAWGIEVASGDVQAGSKFTFDYSYKLPDGISKDDLQFLIYVYNDNTKEIYQVIEHHF